LILDELGLYVFITPLLAICQL